MSKVAIKSGYYFDFFDEEDIPEGVIKSDRKIKFDGKIYNLYRGTTLESERAIDAIYGDKMGYNIDDFEIWEED